MVKVRIYSQPTCPSCQQAKEYMKNKGIEYEDMDVTVDRVAFKELVNVHKVRVVPLILIGDKKLIGFDPVEFDGAYAAAGK